MPVRFMETTSDRSSPLSAENNSSDRESRPRGTKRKQRNRDAARKSRQKQTERADELHEELQGLERDNTALEKEIKALRKELDYYTSTLERHEPHCCLINKTSPINTTLSTPAYVPPRTSHPVTAPAPSTSSTSSLDHTAPPSEMFSSKFPSALEQHKPHCCLINKTSLTNTTLSNPAYVPPRTSHPVTAPAPSTSSTSRLDLHTTPHPQVFSSMFPPVPHSLFSENPSSTIPVCSSFIPTTTMNILKMSERLSQSNSSFPITTTSLALVPCSTLTMSSYDSPFTTEPQTSVTINLPPMGELLVAPHPEEGPQSESLDTPFPPQNLFGDPLRDLSLMEFLEDNDWILNVQ